MEVAMMRSRGQFKTGFSDAHKAQIIELPYEVTTANGSFPGGIHPEKLCLILRVFCLNNACSSVSCSVRTFGHRVVELWGDDECTRFK